MKTIEQFVEELRDAGRLEEVNEQGLTPLMFAILTDNAPLVYALLNANVSLNTLTNGTALMVAAEHYPQYVRPLLERGADLRVIETQKGRNATLAAIMHGHLEAIELLLQQDSQRDYTILRDGQKINFMDFTFIYRLGAIDDQDRLHCLSDGEEEPQKNKEIRAILANHGYLETLSEAGQNLKAQLKYLIAVRENHMSQVIELLEAYPWLLNATLSSGENAAVVSLSCRHIELFNMLVSKGLEWKSPAVMNVVAAKGYIHLLQELLDSGLDVNTLSGFDVDTHCTRASPLFYACRNNRVDMVKFLLKSGAKTDVVNVSRDPLIRLPAAYVCVVNGFSECLVAVLEHGADINELLVGETLLHRAAALGHAHIVAVLLQYRANKSILDDEGRLPSQVALENGHEGCAQLLLNADATEASTPSNGCLRIIGARVTLFDRTVSGAEPITPRTLSFFAEKGVHFTQEDGIVTAVFSPVQ